jgi:hypothetical protein
MVFNEIPQLKSPICHTFERDRATYRIKGQVAGVGGTLVQIRATDSVGLETWLPAGAQMNLGEVDFLRSLQSELLSLVIARIESPPEDIFLLFEEAQFRTAWRRSEGTWFMRAEKRGREHSSEWEPSTNTDRAYEWLANVAASCVTTRRNAFRWADGCSIPRWTEQD